MLTKGASSCNVDNYNVSCYMTSSNYYYINYSGGVSYVDGDNDWYISSDGSSDGHSTIQPE